jgi:hypothetical protein
MALVAFTGAIVVLGLSGQYTSAATPGPDGGCAVSFHGTLASFQMSPEGAWSVTSSACRVTAESDGLTSGTFTGSFTSGSLSGIVSGTWSSTGSTQSISASGTSLTLSFSADQGVGQTPLGSAVQGILSSTSGPAMFVSGTSGQIAIN